MSRGSLALAAALLAAALAGCAADPPGPTAPPDVVVRATPTPTRALPPTPVPPPDPDPAPEPAPDEAPPPDAPPTVPVETSGAAEDRVFALANEARAAAGLAALTRMAALDDVARGWSATLAAEGRDLAHNPAFSREIPPGWSTSGENVAWAPADYAGDPAVVADAIHAGWLESPGHRANLLSPDYTHLGVGVAFSADHGWYLTQNFAAY